MTVALTEAPPPGSGTTIGLAGSEVAGIAVDGDTVRIRLAVAQAQRAAADDGVAPEEGYLPAVELCLTGAALAGASVEALGDAVGALHEGRLTLDGQPTGRLPLPHTLQGQIHLALRFGNGTQVTVSARGLHLRQTRDAPFLGSLAC